MKVMKFEGSNMREAVAKVKAELGDQAVIVSTRQIRRGLLGTACEISAAIDDDDDEVHQGPTRGFAAYQQSERAQNQTAPSTAPSLGQELELERAISPLRGELKSLRALVRAVGRR